MIMNGKNAIEQAQSVAKAIAYIQKNAAKWGGDGQRVIIMGHSAGGHLVSLVNADAALRNQAGMKPILGTLSIDPGAVNLPTQMGYVIKGLHTRYIEAFGRDPKGWEAASPYHQLDKTAAPWLGICSTKRPDDPCGQAEEYAKKSNSLGIKAQPLAIAKSHKAINQDLGKPEQYTYDVEKFMASLDPVVAKLLSSQ
jgi:arylformamidase